MPAYKDHNAEFIINSRVYAELIINSRVIESCGLRQAVVQECQREWAKTPLEVTEPTPRQLICGAIALVPEIAYSMKEAQTASDPFSSRVVVALDEPLFYACLGSGIHFITATEAGPLMWPDPPDLDKPSFKTLSLFCSRDQHRQAILGTPFMQDYFAVASNGRLAIRSRRTPEELCQAPRVEELLKRDLTAPKRPPVTGLFREYPKPDMIRVPFPRTRIFDSVSETTKPCAKCGGDGYCPCCGSGICPECHGIGEMSSDITIDIEGVPFRVSDLKPLLELDSVNLFILPKEKGRSPAYFVYDGGDGLILPWNE